MKIFYTRSPYNEEEDSFVPKNGPFERRISEFLFQETGNSSKTGNWFGVVPPYAELKEIMKLGSIVDNGNVLFEWEPFDLTENVFKEILREVRDHPEWNIEIDFPTSEEEDWGHWALVRALNLDSDRKKT